MASFTLEAPREYVRQQLQSLGIQDISEADLESYTSGKLCGPLLVCTRVRASTSHAQIDKHTNLCVRTASGLENVPQRAHQISIVKEFIWTALCIGSVKMIHCLQQGGRVSPSSSNHPTPLLCSYSLNLYQYTCRFYEAYP